MTIKQELAKRNNSIRQISFFIVIFISYGLFKGTYVPALPVVAVGDGLHLDRKNLMITFPISLTKYTYKHILSTDRTRLMLLVLSLQ